MASTSKTTRISSQNSQELDYDEVQRSYMELVTKHKDELKPLRTRQAVEEAITRIRSDPSSASNLIVKTMAGKKTLFVKETEKKILEVIPVEDSFNIVLNAHVSSNHGDTRDTYERIKNLYSVHICCARWIVASCNVCKLAKAERLKLSMMREGETETDNNILTGVPPTRGVWRLNIMKDVTVPDASNGDKVTFLLMLKEDNTNFLVLRPLCESSGGFALELLKVFTEFGYPEKVCVPNLLHFYEKILYFVFLMNPAEKVPIELVSNIGIFEKDKEEILNEIQRWMTMTGDVYWEQSCHIVQYTLNTTAKLFTRLFSEEQFYGIPFNQFFDYRFRTQMNWIPSPFIKH